MIPSQDSLETRLYARPSSRPESRRPMWLAILAITAVVIVGMAAISLRPKSPSGTGDGGGLPPVNPPPIQDTDADGVSDIDEMNKYGTNLTNPDTDGDGMPDGWEVRQTAKNPLTGDLRIDPLDPTDAYDDPDNDGYDFNHNGYIDGSEQDPVYAGDDLVAPSSHKFPRNTYYTTYNLNLILINPEEHRGELVRIAGARVVDNGSYRARAGEIDSSITINITDPSTNHQLPVLLEPRSNRPRELRDDNAGPGIPADVVDIQGRFESSATGWRITVRGTERFTNLMEYLCAHDYDNDGKINWTDPEKWDTDGDGMSDGWEAHYGQGRVDLSTSPPKWEWTVRLDPTDAGDGGTGNNPACDLDGDRILAPDGREVGYNRDEYLCILDQGLLAILPREKWNLADILARKDIDRKGYAYGTDPSLRDTDRDSFDRRNDGYDPAYDNNTEDFIEIFLTGTDPANPDTDGDGMWDGWEVWYGLCATSPLNRYEDHDGDLLQNCQEYQFRTNPRLWDTDIDGMPDGWEVEYGLDPLDPSDGPKDSDVLDMGGTLVSRPDGLMNLYEYQNGTDPKNPDTDGDHLSDYEETAVGWEVLVEGERQRYFTCASRAGGMDTDSDTKLGPPLPNGSPAGPAGSEFLEQGEADSRHDLNDWNEVMYYRTNASSPDTDGDGLADPVELFTDRDPDLVGPHRTDPRNADTDGDGLSDYVEVSGLRLWLPESAVQVTVATSPLRTDTDNDGLRDGDEVLRDYNPRDVSGKSLSWIRLQKDSDGLYTPVYYPDIGKRVQSTDPSDADTDGDGLPDGYEFQYSDPDCDGLPTWWELVYGYGKMDPFNQDTDWNGIPDMMDDPDSDGLTNLEEYRHRTDPLDPDSAIPGLEPTAALPYLKTRSRNGVKDGDEGALGVDKSRPYRDIWGHALLPRQPVYSDSDGDLMPDWWEAVHGLIPRANDSWDDRDNDGFANLDEYIYGTDPEMPDTDGDGLEDWKDHPFTFSRYAMDRNGNSIGDWWEKYWFGGPCDPNGNPDGPWDPGNRKYGDNWTNFQEWYNSPAGDSRQTFRTNPTSNDTDGDGMNDDFDPDPVAVPFVDPPENPLGSGVRPMNPVIRGDQYGDLDQDDLSNLDEFSYPNGTLDPADPDSDQDGMPDGWELKYRLDPLDPSDALADTDNDGVNYSLKWVDYNANQSPDPGEFIITEYDADRDGVIDPFSENESFCNLEEYRFGRDIDADGINELTSDPNSADTNGDGVMDGYSVAFSDSDGDGLPNLWEWKYGLDALDPRGINGATGDPDGDGYSNIEEYMEFTDPRDNSDHPPGLGRAQDE